MKRKLLFLISSMLCLYQYKGQDIHFSQYAEQPALINPALTGANNPSRASIGYRNQWRSVTSPYITYGASFETRFNSSSWQQVDKFQTKTYKKKSGGRVAGGISVYRDNAGDGNMGNTNVNLSLATFVPTGKKGFLSVGLQGSMVQRRLDNGNLVFPNQYNGTGYDASMNSNETFQNQSATYADFAAGALWSYGQNDPSIFGKRQLKGNIGFSLYHLNKRQSFLINGKNDRSIKFVMHGDLLMGLANPDFAIAPSYLFQFRGTSKELLAGMLVKRYIKMDSKYTGIIKRSSFGIGLYYRNNDAAILSFQVEIKEQLNIGMSYDVNVSRLNKGTNARGGFELTMRYTPPNAFLYQKKETVK